jgi:diguanylate cyclase (GGDEF)-like protein/PAS domain S-box-containing protein
MPGSRQHAVWTVARRLLTDGAHWLLRIDTQDPDRRRRGQILAFICAPLFFIGAGFFVVDLVGWLVPPSEHAAYNMVTDLCFALLTFVAWSLNRRGHVPAAAWLLLTGASAGLVVFFYYTSPQRVEILFVAPVFIAAFALTPWAAFVWAGVSAASYAVLNAIHDGEPRLTLQVGLSLFGLAIVACLVAAVLEWTVAALRRTSRELEADIAARQEAEEARRQVEAALVLARQQSETLFETSTLGVFLFDRDFRATEGNERLASLLQIERQAIIGSELAGAAEGHWLPAMERALAGAVGTYEGPCRTAGGDTLWVSLAASPLRGAEHEIVGGIGVVTDLTDRKQAEDLVDKLAYRDALTGLPNRSLFGDRLRQGIAAAQRRDRGVAVGVLDIDRFKNVNDTLGHECGDELLVGAAERIAGLMRESDSVARSGSDEFLLLFADVVGPRDVAVLTKRILEALREPWRLAGKRVYASATVGLAVYPDDGLDASTLLENAHTAMRRAKQQGGDALHFYDAALSSMAAERLQLEAELHAAIDEGQLTVHYQPQIDARDGFVTGVEALVRWDHPRLGLIPPAEFISMAEETGLIVPLGRQVLRTACAQACTWQRYGPRGLRMAVNVSARQFLDSTLTRDVESVLAETGLDAGLLDIEVTETATLHYAASAEAVLHRLRTLGVAVSLDDFGTGYSSLSQLRRLPITRLKIDRSFVSGIATSDSSAAIVTAVIDLAHALGLEVVAEGVETPEQREFLLRHRCTELQGFIVSRPLPPAECERLLEDLAADAAVASSTSRAAGVPRRRKG